MDFGQWKYAWYQVVLEVSNFTGCNSLELETYPSREFSIHYVPGSRLARLDSACVIVSVEEIVHIGLKDVKMTPFHWNSLSYPGPDLGN
jgi:hypothetical protein